MYEKVIFLFELKGFEDGASEYFFDISKKWLKKG
jgi:hypothetical protein